MVSLVTHKQLKKDYAAKMIDRSLCDNEELAKEVSIMQEIEEHPGVIHLKDVYEEAGSSKFVLILELYVYTLRRKAAKVKNRPHRAPNFVASFLPLISDRLPLFALIMLFHYMLNDLLTHTCSF